MSKKQLWVIDISLVRYIEGTKADVIAEAEDDWEYFQSQYDNGRWNNKPVGEAGVTPINEWSKHTGATHWLSEETLKEGD